MLFDGLETRFGSLSPVQLLALSVLIALPIWLATRSKADPREPPEIKPKIPVIGHLINLMRRGLSYYTDLSLENPDVPIFTISIPGVRSYVVTSPALMTALQRNSRNISFAPFLDIAADRITGCSADSLQILNEKRKGGLGVNQVVIDGMHPALLGDGLDGMNEDMVKGLKPWVDALAHREQGPLDLYGWCREAMTVASTGAVWGPMNPFKDKFYRDCFWNYEEGVANLLPKIAPQIIARKAWKGRETLVGAFVKYYQQNGQKTASLLAQGRYNTHISNGLRLEEVARAETGLGFGLLSNTIPATFWFMYDVFSRSPLLQQLREEIRQNALHIEGKSATIDVADLRDQCPLLVSVFQESLRFRSTGAPTRFVYEDMLLDNKYFLKAGSIVYCPVRPIHSHADVWSTSSKEFLPTRYLRSNPRKVGGFLGYGISPNVCPGRHFATSELVSVAAAMILRFDLSPTTPNSLWIEPELNKNSVVASTTPPIGPYLVNLRVRDEYKDYDWDFRVTRGKGHFPLVIG